MPYVSELPKKVTSKPPKLLEMPVTYKKQRELQKSTKQISRFLMEALKPHILRIYFCRPMRIAFDFSPN